MKKNTGKKRLYIKIALIMLSSIILLSYLATIYVNRTLIPIKLKGLIEKSLSDYTGREADIESLSFSLARGFVLNGIEIYKGQGEKQEFLFKADNISFGIIFIPAFRKYRIIIPRINIDKPYIDLERHEDGTWNISKILNKKTPQEKPSRFAFTVKGVSLNNGEVLLKDRYEKRDINKTIMVAAADIGLALPDSVSLSCTGNIDTKDVRIKSRYKFLNKELVVELDTKDFLFAGYWNDYMGTAPLFPKTSTVDGNRSAAPKVHIYSGSCDLSLKIHMIDFNRTKAYGDMSLRGLRADFNDIGVSGNYSLNGDAGFNIKGPVNPVYEFKLELDDAKVTTAIKPLKSIDNIKGTLLLTEQRWMTKKLSCLLNNSPTLISGTADSPHKDLTADIDLSSTLMLKDIADTAAIAFDSGKAAIDTKIRYRHKDKSYNVSGTSKIEDLRLRQKDITISGNFSINGESQGVVGDWESSKYKGLISFDTARIEGMGLMPLISGASGQAGFNTKSIDIKKLTGNAAGTNINLSGKMDYLGKEPKIDLSIATDRLSITKLIDALPEKFKTRFKDIDAKGICSVNVKLAGTMGKAASFDYNGSLSLKNASVALPYWPNEVSDIDSEIIFQKQDVTWKSLDFNIKDTRYHSYGKLTDFTRPKISLNLKSDDFNLLVEADIDKDNIIYIEKCTGGYRNSTFLLKGKVSDMKTAFAELSGTAYLELKDTPYIFKSRKDALQKLKPDGSLKLTFNMGGPLKDFKDCKLFAEGNSKTIALWGLKLKDFYFDYRMKDNFIDMPVMAAYPYNGVININMRANLKTQEQPYLINIDVKDVDLHELVGDTEMKNKKIKGSFAAKAVLNGYLSKKDSMYGNGWLQVSDGYLWEFPVMRGMMDVIFMMPPEYLTLTDAFGNFTVKNNRIYTEDFKLLSQTASLLWEGSLGFDTTLDFGITGRFAEDVIKKTTEPGRIASALLHEAGSLIMEIRLTGTLAKPKYQIVPFPVKRILQEKVVDRFKDIFGGVF